MIKKGKPTLRLTAMRVLAVLFDTVKYRRIQTSFNSKSLSSQFHILFLLALVKVLFCLPQLSHGSHS